MTAKKTKKKPVKSSKKAAKAPKKTRKNSIDNSAEVFKDLKKEIKPPEEVLAAKAMKASRKLDTEHFESIISELPKSEWSDHAIKLAWQLARYMTETEIEMMNLRIEGAAVKGAQGALVSNPRVTAIKSYNGSIIALRRTLGLQALSRSVQAGKLGARLRNDKDIENAALEMLDDDEGLIAYPSNTMQ